MSQTIPRNIGAHWLWGMMIVGAALRFQGLGRQPLWLDEATTVAFAARHFWGCVFAEIQHPPLFDLVVHFVIRIFGAVMTGVGGEALRVEGASDWLVRAPSAVFGILMIPVMWAMTRRLLRRVEIERLKFADRTVSAEGVVVLATAFVAASPFLVHYSQETRSYMLFALLSLVSTWLFLRWFDEPDGIGARGLWLYVLASILLMYTHYFGAFVLLAHEICYRRWGAPQRKRWLVARGIVVLAFAPWVAWMIHQIVAGLMPIEARHWMGPPWLRIPYALLRFFDGYGVGPGNLDRLTLPFRQLLAEEGPAILLTLAPFLVLLFCGARVARRDKTLQLFFGTLVLLPYAPLVLVSPWMKLIHERYLIFQAPVLLLLVALGVASLKRPLRWLAGLACAASIVFSLGAYYTAPGKLLGYELRYGKENWTYAAMVVDQANVDAVILAPGYIHLAFERYSHLSPAVRRYYFGALSGPGQIGADILPDLSGTPRIALVLSHEGPAELALIDQLKGRARPVMDNWIGYQAGIRILVFEFPANNHPD